MPLSVTLPDSTNLVVPLCYQCYEEVFSAEGWSKLMGRHPKTSGKGEWQDTADVVFEGDFDFSYLQLRLGGKPLPPRRSPIIRVRRSAEYLLEEAAECGICTIVLALDTESCLSNGKVERGQVDFQLFQIDKKSRVYADLVCQVLLRLEVGEKGKSQEWTNSKIVALCHFDGRAEQEVEEGIERSDQQDASSLSSSHLREAKLWLEACEREHDECGHRAAPRVPQRVLDVEQDDSGIIKLVDSGTESTGRYVGLSYVWGSGPRIRLTRSTYVDFLGGIPIASLPQTLQDAVRVTQQLGIRYLWIDSLCLIQDDPSDLTRQIPRMNEYYRGAAVVISASGGSDVHSGFLQHQTRPAQQLDRMKSQLAIDNNRLGRLPYRIIRHYPEGGSYVNMLDIDPPLYRYDDEPINWRGWTLQESQLGSRLLAFPKTGGVIMRCARGTQLVGEILTGPFAGRFGDRYGGFSGLRGREDGLKGEERRSQRDEEAHIHTVFKEWTVLVQDYSSRKLSNPEDSLTAIGALAQEYFTRFGDELGAYIAGLWTKHVCLGLLWHVADATQFQRLISDQHHATIPHGYEAPSWSWASCRKPVTFHLQKEPNMRDTYRVEDPKALEKEQSRILAQLVEHGATYRNGSNPFGAIDAASLTVKAVLISITRTSTDDESSPSAGHVGLDTKDGYKVDKSDLFIPDSMEALALIDSSCFWLPLFDATRARCRGIVVRRLEGEENIFRRLAFAEFMIYSDTLGKGEERVVRLV